MPCDRCRRPLFIWEGARCVPCRHEGSVQFVRIQTLGQIGRVDLIPELMANAMLGMWHFDEPEKSLIIH